MPTEEQIEHWFGYKTPNPETKPKYDAIRAHRVKFVGLMNAVRMVSAAQHSAFSLVNETCVDFARSLNALAPESADKTTAIRAVRHARALLNRAVLAGGDRREYYIARAADCIEDAEIWAEAAIALDGK